MFAAHAASRTGSGLKLIGGKNTQNTATSIPILSPAETLVGDLLVGMAASVGINAAWTPPAGFTEIYDPSSGVDVEALYGLATQDGSWHYEPSTGTSNQKASAAVAFRKAAFDVAGSGVTSSGTGTLVLPSITLSKAGFAVWLVASSNPSATHTGPGAGEELVIASVPGGSYPLVSAFCEKVHPGATGTRTVTIGGTPGNSGGLLVGVIKA